jgi:hypothetical protein
MRIIAAAPKMREIWPALSGRSDVSMRQDHPATDKRRLQDGSG